MKKIINFLLLLLSISSTASYASSKAIIANTPSRTTSLINIPILIQAGTKRIIEVKTITGVQDQVILVDATGKKVQDASGVHFSYKTKTYKKNSGEKDLGHAWIRCSLVIDQQTKNNTHYTIMQGKKVLRTIIVKKK